MFILRKIEQDLIVEEVPISIGPWQLLRTTRWRTCKFLAHRRLLMKDTCGLISQGPSQERRGGVMLNKTFRLSPFPWSRLYAAVLEDVRSRTVSLGRNRWLAQKSGRTSADGERAGLRQTTSN